VSNADHDYIELILIEDGVARRYRMARTVDGCELVPDAPTRLAASGWAFFEDLQDTLDVEFFLAQFDSVLDGSATTVRTGGNITNLEITRHISWLRLLGQRGRGTEIPTGEFYRQLHRLKAFLAAGA
jgi:hypothetical protein